MSTTDYFPTLHEVEKAHVTRALIRARGVHYQAAKLLGISRWAIARKIHKHNITCIKAPTLEQVNEWYMKGQLS